MSPRLSVNINKIALLRNSRGANVPDVLKAAKDCEAFGAQGITVHPRPDERHIRYADARALKPLVKTEFNIEGNPTQDFLDLVRDVRPHQVTLVPDEPGQLTSDHGWDTKKHQSYLKDIIDEMRELGISTSIFLDPRSELIASAAATGTDRIELYTESYAKGYSSNPKKAIAPYMDTANAALEAGLGINAGHDLNLDNLRYLRENLPGLMEVSIGHALIADALYMGLQNTIGLYLRALE